MGEGAVAAGAPIRRAPQRVGVRPTGGRAGGWKVAGPIMCICQVCIPCVC